MVTRALSRNSSSPGSDGRRDEGRRECSYRKDIGAPRTLRCVVERDPAAQRVGGRGALRLVGMGRPSRSDGAPTSCRSCTQACSRGCVSSSTTRRDTLARRPLHGLVPLPTSSPTPSSRTGSTLVAAGPERQSRWRSRFVRRSDRGAIHSGPRRRRSRFWFGELGEQTSTSTSTCGSGRARLLRTSQRDRRARLARAACRRPRRGLRGRRRLR